MGITAAAVLPKDFLPEKKSSTESQLPLPHSNGHNILFVTTEFADLIKVGGLGDVSAALPRALKAHHDVRVLIPGYRKIVQSTYPIKIVARLPGLGAIPPCMIGQMTMVDGLIVYIVLCQPLYDRDGSAYGDCEGRDWSDNHIRFARLALAAAELADGVGSPQWVPDLVHANDWPTGLTPAYMSWRGQQTPCVFTIHNLAYQGLFAPECSVELGLPEDAMRVEGMEFYGKLSFLKAGLNYAAHITTVSRTYAHEITSATHGHGLQGLLRAKTKANQLTGIINGIDDSWDPTSDPRLVERFAPRQWERRSVNTRYVERQFELTGDGPLFAVVSRLVHQKGIDLTIAAAETIVQRGGRLVVIGEGESELERQMTELSQRHPERIAVNLNFCETQARRIIAGSDFLLMPSRYEPCGLSQIYAQCYGSLPIARRTGGLADTIDDGVSGFLFREATLDSYLHAIHRALNVYRHPVLLNAMRSRAMAAPLYWSKTIQPYDRLYRRIISHKFEDLANLSPGEKACAN